MLIYRYIKNKNKIMWLEAVTHEDFIPQNEAVETPKTPDQISAETNEIVWTAHKFAQLVPNAWDRCEAARLGTIDAREWVKDHSKIDLGGLMNECNGDALEISQEWSLQDQIADIEGKITLLNTKDNLTRTERIDLFRLKKEYNALKIQKEEAENQTDAENKEADAENIIWIKDNIDKFTAVYSNLQNNPPEWFPEEALSILRNISILGRDLETNQEELRELFSQLTEVLSKGDNLILVSNSLRKMDEEQGTDSYHQFKSAIISIDASFDSRFQPIDTGYGIKNEISETAEGSVILATLPAGTTEVDDGNINTVTREKDGTLYTYNPTTGERSLSNGLDGYQIGGWESILDANITRQVEKLTWDFEATKEKISSKMKWLTQVIDFIQNLVDSLPIDQAKEMILSMIPSNNSDIISAIQTADSISELKSIANFGILAAKKKQLDDELAKETEQYNKEKELILAPFKEMIEMSDQMKKEVLNLFDEIWIGVGLIPQELLDYVIVQLNGDPGLRQKLWMTEKIDLAQWKLGFDKNPGHSWGLDLSDKKAFAGVINQMIGTDAININDIGTGMRPIPDEADFSTYLLANWFWDSTGGQKAIANLRKGEEETQSKQQET